MTSTLDNSSLLRLILCYFKLKSLIGQQPAELVELEGISGSCSSSPSNTELVQMEETSVLPLPTHSYGVMQELLMEVCVLVLNKEYQ